MKPSYIILLADNAGYGDLGCYGSRLHRTPSIDRLAATGIRFTDFYSSSGVCTPSRASLLTGCYPRRVGMHDDGEGRCVLFPGARKGLSPSETTIAALLRSAGYATACVGKWHLGDQQEFLPTRHGFDRYLGVPYSEDMIPSDRHPGWPPLPLMRGERVVETPVDRRTLTRRYTAEALSFIEECKDRPFFLYLPYATPGSSPEALPGGEFAGISRNGAYGDAIEELDWSAGQILGALERHGIDDRTYVVWASDNGAVRWDPPQGSNAPLRGWGYDTSEGGQRVPCIVRGPQLGPGICRAVSSMMDLYPTFARLAGARIVDSGGVAAMPAGLTAAETGAAGFRSEGPIDGHDLSDRFARLGDHTSPYDEVGFFYYMLGQLQAVRSDRWKLYLPLDAKLVAISGRRAQSPLQLYDLVDDVAETSEVSADHPEVVARLLAMAESARRELGDEDRIGDGQRPGGWVDSRAE